MFLVKANYNAQMKADSRKKKINFPKYLCVFCNDREKTI